MCLDDQLTGDQLNEMIAEIDSDSSGTVDFDGKIRKKCSKWFLTFKHELSFFKSP